MSEQAQKPDWGAIRVRGARENNLKDVSLDIPEDRWGLGRLRRGHGHEPDMRTLGSVA